MIVVPIASNASELISSVIFARKKTKKNISLIMGALYGGVSMNNCICLGLFLLLVAVKNLPWLYLPEIAGLVFITVFVGLIGGLYVTLRLWLVFPVALAFPATVAIVAGMRAVLASS